MFDNHVHTEISADSSMIIEDAIRAANTRGVNLVLTEHMDIEYPGAAEGEDFTFNVEDYFKKYGKLRNDKLLLGMEVGLRPEFLKRNEEIIKSDNFDFVIGSIHVVNGMDIFRKDYYEGKSKKAAYEEYLEAMIKCLKIYNDIDTLGHIDYISRYAPYEDKEIYYDDFSDHIDEVLKLLIEKGKAMEINTRRLNLEGARNNLLKIYSRYRDLGGKIVTVGSDSHNPEAIGGNFKYAIDIINKAGLKNVYFKGREICYDNLDIIK